MQPKHYCCALIGLLSLTRGAFAAGPEFSYTDLIQRLNDLEYLSTVPAPGDNSAQWSSYDRKSRFDPATGKYVEWDANGDGDGIIRKEGDKLVLAEMEGPGCIWRIWSAAPQEGHVRIYLDGEAEPAVDLPFIGYFNLKNLPFTRPALVHAVARGWNNYTPIPYQKSCKIVADAGWGQYYHFNFETFPKDTRVPTFRRDITQEQAAALDQVNRALTECGPIHSDAPSRDLKADFNLPSDGIRTMKLEGPAAVSCLQVKLNLPAGASEIELLRSLIIEIRWDGEPLPSVWAPLGDFFGMAPGINEYQSLPMGVRKDGWWYCNWFMPFAKQAEIRFRNEGEIPVDLHYQITSSPLKREPSDYLRFHAKFHRDAFLAEEPARIIDWPILKTRGVGRFAGVMLHIWNPRGGWWGEGDEKFFVDGERFPSTFGTGSEDYFGYAWCNPGLFRNCYHNQTHNDGNNRGHVSVNRWHIPDNIPFHSSFEGCIEKYYPNQRPTLYAATAYWYLSPDGMDPYGVVPLRERLGYWTPVVTNTKIKGAIEGESLKILAKSGGNPQEQDLTGFEGQWSNDSHLWWIDAKPGDKLDLAIPVPEAGNFNLSVQLTKAPDYGIVQLYLDGRKLSGPIDLYHPGVVPTGLLNLGVQPLTAGEHKLTVEILGANEKAIKSFMFGLDYLKLDSQL